MKHIILLLLGLGWGIQTAAAQEYTPLVTYGPAASTQEGDADFKQIVFLQMPAGLADSLFVRIFDADCGGRHDTPFGGFDTTTRFRLYGGNGAFTAPTATDPAPNAAAQTAGVLLADETIGVDPFRDDKWINLAVIRAGQGEIVGGRAYFKLLIEGAGGNDANSYNLFLSAAELSNQALPEVRTLNFAPTIRLPEANIFSEMRFFVPVGATEVIVHNFDAVGAQVWVETAFRASLPVAPAGQNVWSEARVKLEPHETGRLCALNFKGGSEIPNDASFYVTDTDGKTLAIEQPIFNQAPRRRPVAVVETKTLADCYTVIFDGSRSTDADGDGLQFFWDFGDPSTGSGQAQPVINRNESTGSRVTHDYQKAGTYNASVIITDDSGQVGNSVLQRFKVIVNKAPIAEAGPNVIIAPGETVNFDGSRSTDADGTIQRYVWDFGDGVRTTGVKAAHLFRSAGHYLVFLRVEDGSESPCNFGRDSLTVWVNAQPIVNIGPDLITSPGESVKLSGKRCFDSDGKIIAFEWNYGDGQSGNGQDVEHAYAKPGAYAVIVTIRDDARVSNSSATDTLIVFVNDRPIAVLKSNLRPNHNVSVGEIVSFDGSTSQDRDGQIIAYDWDYGDGQKSPHIPLELDKVKIPPLPQGKAAANAKITHAYDKPGRYRVTLKVTDNSTSATDTHTDTTTVIVNDPPVAKAGEDQLVTASEVFFDGSASHDRDGQLTRFVWTFGDGGRGDGPKPMHVYGSPGTYKVRLVVTDDSQTSTDEDSAFITIVINARPIADAGADQIAAPNQELTFDASGSLDPDGKIDKYEWNFGDGKTASSVKTTHAFAKPGVYTVNLKVADNTGHANAVDYDQIIVRVNAQPIADAGADVRVAPGDMVKLSAERSYDLDGQLKNYQWIFSDGKNGLPVDFPTSTGIKGVVSRTFTEPGIYTATLTVTDNSGAINAQAQDQVTIRINHPPLARPGSDVFTCDATIAFDGTVSGDADGDPLLYTWEFGDGTPPQEGPKPIHTYAKSGTYPVILTVDDGWKLRNSRHTAAMTVVINGAPTANAGKERTVCAGDVIIFDGGGSKDPEGGLLKYAWDFGNGETSTDLNPTTIYRKGGDYPVTLTVKDDANLACNTAVDRVIVRVAESPVAEAGPDQKVCANTEVHFDGSKSWDFDGLVNVFLWDFGDGTTGGGPTPTHVFGAAGTYHVTLTIVGDLVGDCDNTNMDEVIVEVTEAPVAYFTAPKTIPFGETAEFDAAKSLAAKGEKITAWKWTLGDGNTTDGQKISHRYAKPGKYLVSLTVTTDNQTSCNTTSYQTFIFVNQSPLAEAGSAQTVGVHQVTTLNGGQSQDTDGAITAYLWSFADGDTARGLEVRHRFTKPGHYPVTLKVIDNTDLRNNWAVDTVWVTVNDAPRPVIAVENAVAHTGEEIRLNSAQSRDSDGAIARFAWNLDPAHQAEGGAVKNTFGASGHYHLSLIADDSTAAQNHRSATAKRLTVYDKPTAAAGPDRTVCPGQKVAFDAGHAANPDSLPLTYAWDFKDGSTAAGQKTEHIFAKPGRYDVTLTVTDAAAGAFGLIKDTALIKVNAAPIANAGPSAGSGQGRDAYFGGAHDAVIFDATASMDADGDPLMYSWDFGDGKTAQGAIVSHTFTKAGEYRVKLRVRDDSGTVCNEGAAEVVVRVRAHGK